MSLEIDQFRDLIKICIQILSHYVTSNSFLFQQLILEPSHEALMLIASINSHDCGEPAHERSLARALAAGEHTYFYSIRAQTRDRNSSLNG